ncbi:MAG: T9SS type A sorting domain-containing protein, partial [Bacteroidaceae bacterium]|nr:T9SS type A sorting domain-containing protein [Bacteroidaceae bacterium]
TLATEISAAAGAINVVAAQGTATVYTTDGKLVAKAQVNGAATIAVAKGAYIVRVENGNDVVVKKVVL